MLPVGPWSALPLSLHGLIRYTAEQGSIANRDRHRVAVFNLLAPAISPSPDARDERTGGQRIGGSPQSDAVIDHHEHESSGGQAAGDDRTILGQLFA